MPTYEYLCKNESCENGVESFEVEQKITDDPLPGCPKCKYGVQRLISMCPL